MNITNELTGTDCKCENLDDFFNQFNGCIKYPMFYISVLKDLVGEFSMNSVLLGALLSVI